MTKLPKEYLPERIEHVYQLTKEQHKSLKFKLSTQFQKEGIIISDPNEFHKGWACAQFIATLRMATFPFFPDLTEKEKEEIEMKYLKKLMVDLTGE